MNSLPEISVYVFQCAYTVTVSPTSAVTTVSFVTFSPPLAAVYHPTKSYS